jgi:hypothetical protein
MTTKTISLTGTPDYSTLQSWEDATPANLVTAGVGNWTGLIDKASDNFSSAGTLLTISGTTVDSTHYVELTTNTGASFRDNANVQTNALRFNSSNGCSITDTAGYTAAITVSQEFCRFSNLQVTNTSGNGPGVGSAIRSTLVSGTSAMQIDNCILESNAGATGVLNGFGSGMKLRNSLCVQRKSGANVIIVWQNGANIYNSTLAVPSDLTAATAGIDVSNYGGSSSAFENVAVYGASAVKTGTATPTITTSYTDLTASGWTTAAYSTSSGAKFQNITDATRDYRIQSGSALADVGTTDSTNGANDIAGTARPSGSGYDVGCWELVVASTNLWAQSCL